MKKLVWSIVALMSLSVILAGCSKGDSGGNKSDSDAVKADNAKKKKDGD